MMDITSEELSSDYFYNDDIKDRMDTKSMKTDHDILAGMDPATSIDLSDNPMVNYVRKLIRLPNISNDMWTREHFTLIKDFLSIRPQRLLFAYIDRRTSSLILTSSIPTTYVIQIQHGLNYFIRKQQDVQVEMNIQTVT
ncbi:unnamed protein product, partial [Didymodactylos carnosus]